MLQFGMLSTWTISDTSENSSRSDIIIIIIIIITNLVFIDCGCGYSIIIIFILNVIKNGKKSLKREKKKNEKSKK